MALKKMLSTIEGELGIKIADYQSVAGGDINQSLAITTEDAVTYFLKYNDHPQAAEMFRTEANGLTALQETGKLRIPRIIACSSAENTNWLLLEYLQEGNRTPAFWSTFGQQLADLHRETASYFGFHENNFLGTLPQSNAPHATWAQFYATERILPQVHWAFDAQLLTKTDLTQLEKLCSNFHNYFPEEPPALTHGDLWSGNFLCLLNQSPALIDPATAYTHREMDIAMSRLFGGFEATFYSAYQAAYPLVRGYPERESLYQLYYLLAHLNLFGRGYVSAVRQIIRSYS